MDEWFPPSAWLSEVEDTIGSFNLKLTEVWLMDEDKLEENWSCCGPSAGAVFTFRSVAFSLTALLSPCVLLKWVKGSAMPGSFLGTE